MLLHELAHLRRWDDWTNLAQEVVGALFFFHPAVWWIGSRLSLEREMACDDLVLAQTANPRAYAQCLVSVAEKSLQRRGLALAQAAVSRMRHTSYDLLVLVVIVPDEDPLVQVIIAGNVGQLVRAGQSHRPEFFVLGDEALCLGHILGWSESSG